MSMKYERNFYEIKSNEEIFKILSQELGQVGYYDLPFQDIVEYTNYTKKIKQKNIFVIGIGGSSLGTRAIYSFLKTSKKLQKDLFFLDTIDPLKINSLISNVNLNDSHFFVISKSGDTVEPISIFQYLLSKITISNSNCTVISGTNTPLSKYASKKKINQFEIPNNVGGRFSVFSVVGLLPLSAVGIDIKELLSGCMEVHESFFKKGFYYDHIINKARFLVENKSRFVNNIIFSYSSVFEDFNKWYVQLWAESLGKINANGTRQGLTPISLTGPEDQHSFLQLIIDGVRNKTVTIFKIENLMDSTKIPSTQEFSFFDSNFLHNLTFNQLINAQADATYSAIIEQKDIPCDMISISKVDEQNIAKLMYRFQLLTSCIGSFLQINTYDQPGVESGKFFLFERLKNN